MSETRVLVVDDSRMMRTLITSALEEIRNIVVVGEADGADEARVKIAELRPDVLTLDVEMPGMSGIAFLEELMTTKPMPVIMFSTVPRTVRAIRKKRSVWARSAVFPSPSVLPT